MDCSKLSVNEEVLVKSIQGWRQKEVKAAAEGARLEQAKKDAEERDKLRREEAKKIILVDDESKGAAKKVNCDLYAADGRPRYGPLQT